MNAEIRSRTCGASRRAHDVQRTYNDPSVWPLYAADGGLQVARKVATVTEFGGQRFVERALFLSSIALLREKELQVVLCCADGGKTKT